MKSHQKHIETNIFGRKLFAVTLSTSPVLIIETAIESTNVKRNQSWAESQLNSSSAADLDLTYNSGSSNPSLGVNPSF